MNSVCPRVFGGCRPDRPLENRRGTGKGSREKVPGVITGPQLLARISQTCCCACRVDNLPPATFTHPPSFSSPGPCPTMLRPAAPHPENLRFWGFSLVCVSPGSGASPQDEDETLGTTTPSVKGSSPRGARPSPPWQQAEGRWEGVRG
jgi:hypothetical protein